MYSFFIFDVINIFVYDFFFAIKMTQRFNRLPSNYYIGQMAINFSYVIINMFSDTSIII